VYITSGYLKGIHRGHTAYIDANASHITISIATYGAELNTYLKVDTDICTVVSTANVATATREQLICAKGIADVLSRHINYSEMMGTIAPQNRVDTVPAHLYQDIFAHIQLSLKKDMREEHAKAINYNLHTGTIRRWY
jgi:hypothetical protein